TALPVRTTRRFRQSLLQIERVAFQRLERHHRERLLVRRLEHHRRRDVGLERLAPRRGTDAPAIARLQARKTELGYGRDEIVASTLGKAQELRRHLRAHDMQPEVLRTGVAAPIAKESGAR